MYGKYSIVVSNQEQVLMARIWYYLHSQKPQVCNHLGKKVGKHVCSGSKKAHLQPFWVGALAYSSTRYDYITVGGPFGSQDQKHHHNYIELDLTWSLQQPQAEKSTRGFGFFIRQCHPGVPGSSSRQDPLVGCDLYFSLCHSCHLRCQHSQK